MDIAHIDNLISDKYRVGKNGKYILEEKTKSEFPKTKLIHKGMQLLYKFDEDKKLLPFFKDVEGAKSMSDYVVFIINKNNLFVFIIELSKTRKKYNQYEPTRLFVDYILKTCERLNKCSLSAIFKYILITKKVYKRNTKVKNEDSYNTHAGEDLDLSIYCIA